MYIHNMLYIYTSPISDTALISWSDLDRPVKSSCNTSCGQLLELILAADKRSKRAKTVCALHIARAYKLQCLHASTVPFVSKLKIIQNSRICAARQFSLKSQELAVDVILRRASWSLAQLDWKWPKLVQCLKWFTTWSNFSLDGLGHLGSLSGPPQQSMQKLRLCRGCLASCSVPSLQRCWFRQVLSQCLVYEGCLTHSLFNLATCRSSPSQEIQT